MKTEEDEEWKEANNNFVYWVILLTGTISRLKYRVALFQ